MEFKPNEALRHVLHITIIINCKTAMWVHVHHYIQKMQEEQCVFEVC